MFSDIVSRLRRDAEFLLDLHKKQHPDRKASAPRYVKTMLEAAEEIEIRQKMAAGSDLCTCCGRPVPEGRQVCWQCEHRIEREEDLQ